MSKFKPRRVALPRKSPSLQLHQPLPGTASAVACQVYIQVIVDGAPSSLVGGAPSSLLLIETNQRNTG